MGVGVFKLPGLAARGAEPSAGMRAHEAPRAQGPSDIGATKRVSSERVSSDRMDMRVLPAGARQLPAPLPERGARTSPLQARLQQLSSTRPASARAPEVAARRTDDARADAAAIACALRTPNAWSVLRGATTEKDLVDVQNMCREINPARWEEIYVAFWDGVLEARAARPPELVARDAALPDTWFHEPFYYTYVQYFGAEHEGGTATFDDLTRMLDYLESAGIQNLFLLPHYASPMGDGGYDVSDFSPREDLGGRAAYERFLEVAHARGFRVATDLPLNHTSMEHPWLKAGLAGDDEKLGYYLRCDGVEKLREEDRDGDLVAVYREADGSLSERTLIFPDVVRDHSRTFQRADGTDVRLYREFYPFQIDLDLTNPALLTEVFKLVGDELNDGILGKRTDAIAHWVKKAGTTADGLGETHALQAMLKSYARHICPKMVVLPEAVRGMDELKKYAGVQTEIAGKTCASEGDALFNFQMQGALREMTYLQTTKPFWEQVFAIPDLPAQATMMNFLEHHDETYLGMISAGRRAELAQHVEARGGIVYKNGMSAGGRYADNLDHDPRRLATAIFALYLTPGVPIMYYGTEVGARSQPAHAARAQERQHQIFRELGMDVPAEKAFDPRELQRGVVTRDALERGKGSASFQRFAQLNRLRQERPSLASPLLTPVDTGRDDVLGMVKFVRDGSDAPLFALANLAGERRAVAIPMSQLREKLGVQGAAFALADLLADGAHRSVARLPDDKLLITLEPFESVLCEAKQPELSPGRSAP